MRIAYFINQYPAGSHTFIRREIYAIEALGATVIRFALRPGTNLVDDEDKTEVKRTRFVFDAGFAELFSGVCLLLRRPLAVVSIIRQALVMGWHSDRGILRHLAYAAESIVVANWCRRFKIQHIHAHFGTNSAAIAMFASRLSGIPFSFTVHGPEEFEKGTLLSLDAKVRNASFVACISSFGRSQLMRLSHPGQWKKINIIHCGLDNQFLRASSQAPESAHRLVCVARLSSEKGHLVLVAAAEKLREFGVKCEIVLVGDGPLRKFIGGAIRKAGLEATVKITGWISGERVRAEIEAASALVLPSFSEGLPVVIMEAMALKRPVISTYVAGIPEIVQPGKTGWLVPAGDEDALAQAMREAVETPIDRLAEMGAAGQRHIYDQHDVLKEAKKLKSLIESSDTVAHQ